MHYNIAFQGLIEGPIQKISITNEVLHLEFEEVMFLVVQPLN
jgi:hypothetical protein